VQSSYHVQMPCVAHSMSIEFSRFLNSIRAILRGSLSRVSNVVPLIFQFMLYTNDNLRHRVTGTLFYFWLQNTHPGARPASGTRGLTTSRPLETVAVGYSVIISEVLL